MIRRAQLLPWIFLVPAAAFGTLGCSASGGPKNGGSSPSGDGGTPGAGGGDDGGSGGDGSPSDGGSSPGTGGNENGGGGTNGSGGSGNSASSVCPSGYEGMTPTIPASPMWSQVTAPSVAGQNWFLEGPVWDGTHLYVSHIRDWGDPTPPARILRLDGDSLVEFIKDDLAGTNGLALYNDGRLLAASHRVHGLLLFDFDDPGATPEVLVDEYQGKPFNSPNDLAVRSDGNVYFTDPDYQCTQCPQDANRLYHVKPNGDAVGITTPYSKPNGVALSLDENVLYVAGDGPGITAYQLDADGNIGTSSTFANAQNSINGVDGMTLDCAGNLYATEHSQNLVKIYTPSGTYVGQLAVPSSQGVTNVAFGGSERKTLYVTTLSNDLYAVELDIPGLPY